MKIETNMKKRIVITGIGLITPIGLDKKETWQSLISGDSGIDTISCFDPEAYETKIAAEVKGFDPTILIGKKESRRLDRFSQFAVASSIQALEDANIDMENEDQSRVGVMIGSGVGGIITLSEQYTVLEKRGPTRVSPFLIPMMLGDMASGQVSMNIGAKGPNFSVVSACATGADSIGVAADMIKDERIDVAIAELNIEKRKATLSIKLLEELQNKEAVSKFSSPLSGKNLPFSSLSDKLDKKEKKTKKK